MEEYKSENNPSSVKRRAIDAVADTLQKLKSKPTPALRLLHSSKQVSSTAMEAAPSPILRILHSRTRVKRKVVDAAPNSRLRESASQVSGK